MKRLSRIHIDYRTVSNVTGSLLFVEAVMLLLPLLVSLLYGEGEWWIFLSAAALSAVAGVGLIQLGGGRHYKLQMNRREGYLLTTFIWIVYSLIGMVPFLFMPSPLNVTDAFFETMSGFTTTGATVFADVESLSHGILFWRALTQWVGGLGIVIFMLVVLPTLNQSGSVSLFNAEVTGITHDKLHPRVGQTAKSLLYVYLLLTAVLILLLWCGPMNLFDAVCQGFSTMSTGGFSTRNASIAAWNSDYVGWVVAIFMLVGGVNFMLLYGLLRGNWRPLVRNDVFRAYGFIVLVSWGLFALARFINGNDGGIGRNLLEPLFQVATTITTTGFSFGSYEGWGQLALSVILILMLMGACAGSTTGAVKIDRFVAVWKNMRRSMELALYPQHTVTLVINGHALEETHISRIASFFAFYLILLIAGAMLMSGYGYSFTDSLFASASCIGNNGLGYGATGAGGGFGTLPASVKWLYSLLMLTGRLEVFTVIVIFSRKFWRR